MNKTFKGALGASAAAVLLLGGAGSLAFWSDDAEVNGGTVNSGYLTIDPLASFGNAPKTACEADWKHTNGLTGKAGTTVVNIVPGDIITKTCTFTVTAKGDNLQATPTVPATIGYTTSKGGSAVTPASLDLPVAATYALGAPGATGTEFSGTSKVTEDDNGKTLTTKITVSFPYSLLNGKNVNDTQNLLVTLNKLEVKLVQDNAGA